MRGRGAMFSAMWLQETEEVGEETRLGTAGKAGKRDLNHIVSYQVSLCIPVLSSGPDSHGKW